MGNLRSSKTWLAKTDGELGLAHGLESFAAPNPYSQFLKLQSIKTLFRD